MPDQALPGSPGRAWLVSVAVSVAVVLGPAVPPVCSAASRTIEISHLALGLSGPHVGMTALLGRGVRAVQELMD